jgi:hypothetical protein
MAAHRSSRFQKESAAGRDYHDIPEVTERNSAHLASAWDEMPKILRAECSMAMRMRS